MTQTLSRIRRVTLTAATLLFCLAGVGSSGAQPPQAVVSSAEPIFVEAENLLRVGRVEQARQRFQQIIDEFPAADFPDLVWRAAARVRLGNIRRRSSPTAAAGVEYVEVLEREPLSPWTSRARMGLAAIALEYGDWQAAVQMLQRVISAAETGLADADSTASDEASRRLALIERFRLRPLLQRPYWSTTTSLRLGGVRFDHPMAVAAAADGQLLIVDDKIPAVLLVDAAHATHSRLGFNDHGRPWWGADGLPYLPTRRAGVIALGGGRLGFLAKDGTRPVPLKDVRGGARTPSGHWYLLDFSPRRILRFGPDGEYEGQVTRELEQPADLAVDASGRLYVLDRGAKAVVRFLPDGSRDGRLIAAAWRRPEAVEVDAVGNIYVLDRDARTIDVYDEAATRLARLGPTLPGGIALRDPYDIAVDGRGRVVVADRGASSVYVVQ